MEWYSAPCSDNTSFEAPVNVARTSQKRVATLCLSRSSVRAYPALAAAPAVPAEGKCAPAPDVVELRVVVDDTINALAKSSSYPGWYSHSAGSMGVHWFDG